MRRRYWAGVLLLAAGFVAPARGADPVQLEWKFQEKDTFRLESVSTFKQTLKALGKDIKQDLEQTTIMRFTVVEKTKDKVVLEQKLESLAIKNLAAPADKPDAKLIQQMQGATFTITLTPKMDKITEFKGYDDLIKRIAGEDRDVQKTVKAILTEDVVKKSALEALAFLPDEAVAAGGKWERKMTEPLGPLGSLSRTTSYVYEGNAKVKDKTVEKITFTAVVSYNAPATKEGDAPLQVKEGKLEVPSYKGTLYFDAAAGRLVQFETKMILKGALTLSVSGTNIPTDVQQEVSTRTELLPEDPKK